MKNILLESSNELGVAKANLMKQFQFIVLIGTKLLCLDFSSTYSCQEFRSKKIFYFFKFSQILFLVSMILGGCATTKWVKDIYPGAATGFVRYYSNNDGYDILVFASDVKCANYIIMRQSEESNMNIKETYVILLGDSCEKLDSLKHQPEKIDVVTEQGHQYLRYRYFGGDIWGKLFGFADDVFIYNGVVSHMCAQGRDGP